MDLHAVSIAEGVRAGLAIAAVVALHEWLQWPGLMETALAAQLTCLCDAGGSVQRRLPALLCFCVVGAALTAGFGLLRGAPGWVEVPLAGLAVFCCAFARSLGASAMQVGNLLTVVLALALRAAAPPPAMAPWVGLTFLGGGMWALLLTMVIWRTQPYRPARNAVADCLRALAAMARDMRRALSGSEEAWDLHARVQRRTVRDSLERARAAVLDTVRTRGPAAGHAAQSWLRLEAIDQLFAALIALSDVLSGPLDEAARLRAERLLRLLPPVLLLVAREVAHESPVLRPGLDRAIAALAGAADAPPDGVAATLGGLARTIAERVRAALSPVGGAGQMPAVPQPRRIDMLRANLAWDSDVLRHALRAAATATLAFAAMRIWPLSYLHWFVMTLLLTLQPYFALTVVRAAERVGGTVVGGFLAAAIGLVATTPLALAAVLFPLTVVALGVRGVSFGLFMAALTPEVVLLSELGQPGSHGLDIALMRALFTALGGAAALLSAWLLWPSWEPARLHVQMRAVLAAHRRLAAIVIARQLGAGDDDGGQVDAARREAGAASNAFEASLQRVMLERGLGRFSASALEAMLTIDAAMRRLAGRLVALAHAPADISPGVNGDAGWRAVDDWLGVSLGRLAAGERDIPPRPALIAGEAEGPLARLARPVELAAGAVAKL